MITSSTSGTTQGSSPSLFPHQARGVEFLRRTPRALLADEMGLGKTAQAITALEGVSPVLAISPASVTGVWERELQTWASGVPYRVLRGPLVERRKALQEPYSGWTSVNYEVVAKLLPDLLRHPWAGLVLDEAHRVKNRKAQVTKAVQRLSRSIPRRILLTGTPILNRPDDLWSLLNTLYPERYRSYWRFVNRFCEVVWNGYGWEVGGPRAPEALRQEISSFYLRREKEEVLKDLPPKVSQQLWVDLEGEQLREYLRMKEEFIALLGTKEISAVAVVSQLLRLRQICVDPQILIDDISRPLSGCKARALVDLLEGRNGGKVVIFSQYSRAVRATSLLLGQLGISHAQLTGETPPREREEIVQRFQTQKDPHVLVATIGTGGLGLTLTTADTAVFLDKDWTPALNSQAQDRLHRIGQKSTVWIYEILSRGTVEERVERLLAQKISWAEDILSHAVDLV